MTMPYGLLGAPQAQPTGGLLSPDEIRASLPTAPIPDPPMSLLQHLEQRIMAVPQASQSLLSGSDVDHARRQGLLHAGMAMLANSRGAPGQNAPGFGQAVAAGLGAMQQGFQGDMQNSIGAQQQAMQMGAAQHAATMQNAQDAARQAISQKYQPLLSSAQTPEQRIGLLTQMSSEYANAGLTKEASDLASLAKAQHDMHMAGKPQMAQYGKGVTTFDPVNHPDAPVYDPGANGGKGGWALNVDRGLSDDQKQENADKHAEAAARIAEAYEQLRATREQRQMMMGQHEAGSFAKANGQLINGATQFGQSISALNIAAGDPAHGVAPNPAAAKTAIVNAIATLDPKVSLRQGTLQYLKQIDPSFSGNVQATLYRLTTGNLPPQQIGMLRDLLVRIHQDNATMYESRRAARVKANPYAESFIPSTGELFGTSPTAAAPAPAPARGYSTDNPFAKKP